MIFGRADKNSEMSWSHRFDDSIQPLKGKPLVTLKHSSPT
jgi:hypothetical protein